jgi:PEP-CTERM motif
VLATALYTYSHPPTDEFSPFQEGDFPRVERVHQIRYVDAFETAGSGVPQIFVDSPNFTTAIVGAWSVPEPATLILITALLCGLSILAYRCRRGQVSRQ